MISAKIGERNYEFEDLGTFNKAKEIYNENIGDQNGFETEMEDQNIDFWIELFTGELE